jgi:hypothetical protein
MFWLPCPASLLIRVFALQFLGLNPCLRESYLLSLSEQQLIPSFSLSCCVCIAHTQTYYVVLHERGATSGFGNFSFEKQPENELIFFTVELR